MNFDSPVFRIGGGFYLLLIIFTLTASGQSSVPRFESDECAVPTMVVTSEYDAYTPPAWGQAVAKNLKNSFLFEIPGVGHGPAFSTPCLSEMINEFGDDPKSSPNSDCLEKLKSNKNFVTEVPKS